MGILLFLWLALPDFSGCWRYMHWKGDIGKIIIEQQGDSIEGEILSAYTKGTEMQPAVLKGNVFLDTLRFNVWKKLTETEALRRNRLKEHLKIPLWENIANGVAILDSSKNIIFGFQICAIECSFTAYAPYVVCVRCSLMGASSMSKKYWSFDRKCAKQLQEYLVGKWIHPKDTSLLKKEVYIVTIKKYMKCVRSLFEDIF